MKNIFNIKLLIFILVALMIGVSAAFAYSYVANEIGFTPDNNKWNVDNEKDALDALYTLAICDDSMIGESWDYTPYTEGYTFISPCFGRFKLEVWGAQGGNYNSTAFGGYGGYSTGNIRLSRNQKFYIHIGGAGSVVTAGNVTGGYNGGGNATVSDYTAGSGGGATHIAFSSGLLKELETNRSSVIIVAGGGGGSYYEGSIYGYGGSGGGYIGGDSSGTVTNRSHKIPSSGGTQTSGGIQGKYYNSTFPGLGAISDGSFGQGGSYQSAGYDTQIAAGGGGWFGGGVTLQGAGSGGSGYISYGLTNKAMYCFRCQESSDTSTKTISTTGSSSERDTVNCPSGYSTTPISKCAKAGGGFARITYLGR